MSGFQSEYSDANGIYEYAGEILISPFIECGYIPVYTLVNPDSGFSYAFVDNRVSSQNLFYNIFWGFFRFSSLGPAGLAKLINDILFGFVQRDAAAIFLGGLLQDSLVIFAANAPVSPEIFQRSYDKANLDDLIREGLVQTFLGSNAVDLNTTCGACGACSFSLSF